MSKLIPLNIIILEFMCTMVSDLKRRSMDESGEQRMETEGRIETLKQLIEEVKNRKGSES